MVRRLTDWYTAYQDFTAMFEPPPLFNKWSALMALSTAVGRKVWLLDGNLKTFPNLYIIFVGPSGVGKTTAMREIRPFIERTGIRFSASKVNHPSQLIKDMPNGQMMDESMGLITPYLIYAEEFPSFLGTAAYENGLISLLTDLYDCTDAYPYRTVKGDNIIEIVVPQPYLCVFGGTTASGVFDVLPPGTVGQGFTSRLLFVCTTYGGKRVPEKPWLPQHQNLYERLMNDIEIISRLRGPMKLSDMSGILWRDFYIHRLAPDEEFKDERMAGYSSRKPLHLKKLAMLLSLSESDKMIVEAHHLEEAMTLLTDVETSFHEAYEEIAPTKTIGIQPKILKALGDAKQHTMAHSDLLRRFSHVVDSMQFRIAINSLLEQKRIETLQEPGRLRPITLYRLL